jgi:hypothetical protein
MRTFSDWKHEKDDDKSINESTSSMADVLRAKLSSSTGYLKQALGPVVGSQNTAAPIQPENELEKQLKILEERIHQELDRTKKEPESQVLEEVEEIQKNDEFVIEDKSDLYKLYRDKEETFECSIQVEGASLASTSARLIIESAHMNLVFYGRLHKDGRCVVPLKKMNMLPEGTRGQIRLEVIVDDTVFSPWETNCMVEGAKKVSVDIKNKKSVSINLGGTK